MIWMGVKTGCKIGLEGSHLMGIILPWRPLTSRIPQGSVLGPVPFSISTNNLEEVTQCALLSNLQRPLNWGEMAKENIFKEKYGAGEHH